MHRCEPGVNRGRRRSGGRRTGGPADRRHRQRYRIRKARTGAHAREAVNRALRAPKTSAKPAPFRPRSRGLQAPLQRAGEPPTSLYQSDAARRAIAARRRKSQAPVNHPPSPSTRLAAVGSSPRCGGGRPRLTLPPSGDAHGPGPAPHAVAPLQVPNGNGGPGDPSAASLAGRSTRSTRPAARGNLATWHGAMYPAPRASRITHRASRMAYRASMLATARAERRSIRIRPCRTLLPSPRYVAPIRPRAPRHMRQSVENSIEEPLDDSIAGSVDHSPPQEAIRGSGSTRSIPGNNARRRVEGRSAGERAEDIADTSHWLPERPARCLSRGAGCIRARADASVRAQSRNARDRASGDIVDAAMPRSHVAIREAAIAAVRSSFGDCALRSRGGSFSRRRRCACPCVPPR